MSIRKCLGVRCAFHQNEKEVEEAFKAGYHCQWLKVEEKFIFDPNMKPGAADEAFKAYLRSVKDE